MLPTPSAILLVCLPLLHACDKTEPVGLKPEILGLKGQELLLFLFFRSVFFTSNFEDH